MASLAALFVRWAESGAWAENLRLLMGARVHPRRPMLRSCSITAERIAVLAEKARLIHN